MDAPRSTKEKNLADLGRPPLGSHFHRWCCPTNRDSRVGRPSSNDPGLTPFEIFIEAKMPSDKSLSCQSDLATSFRRSRRFSVVVHRLRFNLVVRTPQS